MKNMEVRRGRGKPNVAMADKPYGLPILTIANEVTEYQK